MYRNLNNCPEIEELKKAILRDLPEDAINSNSNSKDKLSLIHKKEKDVALNFLRQFNEAQEKTAFERKQKERENEEKIRLEQEMELFRQQQENLRKSESNFQKIEEKSRKTEESFQKPVEKFSRLANLNDLEDFNNAVIKQSNFSNDRNLKKRKMATKPLEQPQKKMKEDTKTLNNISNTILKKNVTNKVRIEFKKPEEIVKPETITIKNKPLQFYTNEDKICHETSNFSFVGKIVECTRVDQIWFIGIEKIDRNSNNKMCFKAIYNMNLNQEENGNKKQKLKELKQGYEYIFEFKSTPKEFKMSYVVFLEAVFALGS